MDGVRLRVADRNLQHVVGKLGRRAGGRHLGEVLPRFRFDSAEHVGGAATLVFAIAPRHSSRPHGQGRTNLLVEHHRFLIHTNPRFPFTQRLFVHGQDVFHPPDVLLIQFRHAPHFFPATASGRGFPARPESFPVPPRGTSLRFTTSSVSRRTVQRERPSGGGPHASATMRCRWCASSKAAFPGRGRSYKARSRPPWRSRRLVSHTVFGVNPTFFATCRMGCPSANCRRAKARSTVRTGCKPLCNKRRNSCCSPLDNRTPDRSFMSQL